MSKAKQTKAYIIEQAAELFNLKGYAASSIADIMQATGLKKGGIYNHFKSKDELALAALDYAVSLLNQRMWTVVKTKSNAGDRLQALVASYLIYIDDPPIVGGCPILNTAIETDDTNSPLRDRALLAMNSSRSLIVRIIKTGMKKGEIQSTVEPDLIATIIFATLEGGIMMSKLERNPIHLKRVVAHLQTYIKDLALNN